MTSTYPATIRSWDDPAAPPIGRPGVPTGAASTGAASSGAASAGVAGGPRLHAPPAPGHVPATEVLFDPVAASIRNQVIDRLVRMSVRHAIFAWERRRTRPVAPHALAFLYADPLPADDVQQRFYQVVAATRMVNDDPGVRELARLLYRLSTLAQQRYVPAAGGFDPAVHMSNHHDPACGQASYIGLGVSTLDTPTGTWEEIQQQVADCADIPGRCFALLADHSAILLDRAGRAGFNEVSVRATADLSVTPGLARRAWVHHPDTASMPAPPDVWQRLYELHTLALDQPHRPTL